MKSIITLIYLIISTAAMITLLDWATAATAHTTWPRYLAQGLIITDTVLIFIMATLASWHWMDTPNQ